jgi:uncharacterized protein
MMTGPVESKAMAEANKLDEPLTDVDYDDLEVFLGSNAVPQDCMDLEMLDGFLTAIVSGPELIQPSEWLPVVWSDSQRTVTPVFQNNEQAERILSLVLRLQQSIRRTLAESPTRFKPLLYHPEQTLREERSPPEASAWCEGYMTGVLLREEAWEPLYAEDATRDWMLPVEALAYGDHDPEYLDWVDSEEKRLDMIDELPIAAVLVYRFWQDKNRPDSPGRAERRAQRREASRKGRQRLH